jgi:hypothetical protein
VIAHRIKLSSDSLNLRVDVDDNGQIAIATIAGGGTSLRAGHHVPALELQSVEAPHPTPVLRSPALPARPGSAIESTRPASMAKPTGWR